MFLEGQDEFRIHSNPLKKAWTFVLPTSSDDFTKEKVGVNKIRENPQNTRLRPTNPLFIVRLSQLSILGLSQ